MKKLISQDKAEALVAFAQENNALVEQKAFTNFSRSVISTPDGCVALKSYFSERETEEYTKHELEIFRGFDNKASIIAQKGVIKIKGFTYA